jgi:hypothetical protein
LALTYCGITTTPLEDGSTTNPIIISNNDHTATAGCVVFYGDKEFVFNGTAWEELGYSIDLTGYKTKQTAVSSPSASGNTTSFIDTISQDANGKITVTKKNVKFPTETDPVFTASAAAGITANDIANWNGKTDNVGTVTSITVGTGLSSTNATITDSDSIALKSASTSEIGGIKVSNVADQTMATTAAKKYWPVNITTAGVAYVGLPNFTTNSGDITGVTAGKGLTGGASSGAATLNVGAGTGIEVGDDTVGISTDYQTKINNGETAYG